MNNISAGIKVGDYYLQVFDKNCYYIYKVVSANPLDGSFISEVFNEDHKLISSNECTSLEYFTSYSDLIKINSKIVQLLYE